MPKPTSTPKRTSNPFGTIYHVTDGETLRYHTRKDGRSLSYEICCDCCLAHRVEMLPRKNYIRVRVWRDDEKTAWLRSKKKKRKKS